MRMRGNISKGHRSACQICELLGKPTIGSAAIGSRRLISVRANVGPPRCPSLQVTIGSLQNLTSFHAGRRLLSYSQAPGTSGSESPRQPTSAIDLDSVVRKVNAFIQRLEGTPENGLYSASDVIDALKGLQKFAESVVEAATVARSETTSSLLKIEDEASPATAAAEVWPATLGGPYRDAIGLISNAAFELVVHPNVFISSKVLQHYVDVQSRLGKPETLAHVFELYANKPLPRPSKSGTRFIKQNPKAIKNAIPPAIADAALDTAITVRNIDAAVAIIESSYNAPAFLRAKLFNKALAPAMAVTLAPVVVYQIASELASAQNTMSTEYATNVAFAGIMAYVFVTGSLGVLSKVTFNSQMKRVIWQIGVPLHRRWLREEQRLAYDKLACAWGFQEPNRYGEESAPEWIILKEYLGHKGMLLDPINLTEGLN